jgi:hypothetical protein
MKPISSIVVCALMPGGAGDLFGLGVWLNGAGVYFVNDGTNTLDLLH